MTFLIYSQTNKTMKTGKHNSNYKEDYDKSLLSESQLRAINKEDFFKLLKTYSHLSDFCEEEETEMIVSDAVGRDIYIAFEPSQDVEYGINHITGVPESDEGDLRIEIFEIIYTTNYEAESVFTYQDFDKTELKQIKDFIKTFCQL